MLFNSIQFAIFLPIIFILYWFVVGRNFKWQNILLLVASYYFYACWDWRFLFLLIFSTLLDYFTGLRMSTSSNQELKKFWLWLSIIINLGFLGIFKYYNFFIESFAAALKNYNLEVNPWTFKIILPVGISFYTFHGLSYVIDVYKDRLKAEKNFIDYAVFVSFFPLLVAGPIERATHLLPQIQRVRVFNDSKMVDGLRQILWGLFKKIVIADQCAFYANQIFDSSSSFNGSTLLIGAIFFSFQIYCDFSGYSDIALGTARLFGIELLRNFAYPYFSRDIAEFWRRWHISLSSWFRDYVYIPLGGSKGGTWYSLRNILIIFVISGFWHGANWTFIFWGLLNGIYFIPLLLLRKNRNHLDIVAKNRVWPTTNELTSIIFTFTITIFAWIFFRAENMSHAFAYISNIFSSNFFEIPLYEKRFYSILLTGLIGFMIFFEWNGRMNLHALEDIELKFSYLKRRGLYYFLILLIFIFRGAEQEFIYFQF